ncbi:hypothetical protein [Rhodococcus zopfii]|uniref:hypothetical protein n=1 Tax=Rhodococcus zopfii TaxID=43772 RepID=UPI0009330384|nr:hypothetical protein [Rhodococcus zopfii]
MTGAGGRGDDPRGDLPLGKLALAVVGSATVVLALVTVLMIVLQPRPVVGLIIVLVGIACAIAVMGLVSTRMTRRAYGRGDDRS